MVLISVLTSNAYRRLHYSRARPLKIFALILAINLNLVGTTRAQDVEFPLPVVDTNMSVGLSRSQVEDMLDNYITDVQRDSSANLDMVFGIEIRDHSSWRVQLNANDNGLPTASLEPAVSMHEMDEPLAYFTLDLPTLVNLYLGKMTALTAMGKAKGSDYAPMDIRWTADFAPEPDFWGHILPLSFHFWTRGIPEIVDYDDPESTRLVHGANVAVLYYQKGFRSAWYQIRKGQHINEEKSDQVNEFPSLLVITGGTIEARIGGQELQLSKGRSVFIPAQVAHEFWNDADEPADALLLMFGEGA